ncbi:hypothetical protein C8R46DRAFT_1200578 [Mycena filopes]|nr:hypothetical protein C8R46DRAFT_1200578 [Mycena filopes]
MLASSGKQTTIGYFLRLHRARSPHTIPRIFMSDFDWPQINAIIAEYQSYIANLQLFILLCWWHVLHAWQQHFHISSHPELWELLKNWIRITDVEEFNAAWAKIKTIAPAAFINYLNQYWMSDRVVRMWSAVYRKDRTLFENCDTNMLIEAWHHILKWKFLHGKRNRRLDHLLNTLLTEVLPYYALKQRRQDFGFEGVDIEVTKRKDIVARSKIYVKGDIEALGDAKYLVPSKSNPSKVYEVDIDAYTCTCLDYPLLCYCKHICAVQELFDEQQPPSSSNGNPQQPLNSLDVPSLSTLSPVANVNAPVQVRKSNVLNVVMDKLDRLGARLRGRGRSAPSLSGRLQELEAAVDALLLETDADSVLPSAQRLPPVVKDRSARQAMMPEVKTRKKPAGDSAYGCGVSSGSKAKKAKLKATSPVLPSTSTPQPRPTAPALINPLLMQLPPQTAFAYYPPHPYPYPHYPQYLVPPQYPPSQYPTAGASDHPIIAAHTPYYTYAPPP